MRNNRKGFTLVEVILGIALLGMIVAPFSLSLVTSIRALGFSKDRMRANALAQQYMEKVKMEDFSLVHTFPIHYQYTDGQFITSVSVTEFGEDEYKKTAEVVDEREYDCNITLQDGKLLLGNRQYTLGDGDLEISLEKDGRHLRFHSDTVNAAWNIDPGNVAVKMMCRGENETCVSLRNDTDTAAGSKLSFTLQGDASSSSKINLITGIGNIEVHKMQKTTVRRDAENNIITGPEDRVYDISVDVNKEEKRIISLSGTKKVTE